MAETFRSDGKSVVVTLTAAKPKGSPVVVDKFHGITMAAGSSGDQVALEIAQREHEIAIPNAITAAKGDVIYISTAGAITNTTTDKPFMKITSAKDANNIVWGVLLPQVA